jgi:hypothetical protein
MEQYSEDIWFVLTEAARYAEMDFNQLKKLPLNDSLSYLPHPSGLGNLICGQQALKRLQSLAERRISNSEYFGRIDSEAVVEPLKQFLVETFISDKAEVNGENCKKVIERAIEVASAKICTRTHLIPCKLFFSEGNSTKQFQIGPVTFRVKPQSFEYHAPAFSAYLNNVPSYSDLTQTEKHKDFLKKLFDDVQEYFDSFGWTAEVTLSGFDVKTSERRAERMVQSALDCFHVLFGTSDTHRMRVSGPHHREDRRGRIYIDENKKIAAVSTSSTWYEHYFPSDWWTQFNESGGERFREIAGLALAAGYELPKAAPLATRFLDAAAWYGEAARDKFAASRIVKYITAIERTLITQYDLDITRTIANRGASLISNDETSFIKNRKRLRQIYKLRSKLVHGFGSPYDPEMKTLLFDAEQLSRAILLHSLIMFGKERISNNTITPKELHVAYSNLEKKNISV